MKRPVATPAAFFTPSASSISPLGGSLASLAGGLPHAVFIIVLLVILAVSFFTLS